METIREFANGKEVMVEIPNFRLLLSILRCAGCQTEIIKRDHWLYPSESIQVEQFLGLPSATTCEGYYARNYICPTCKTNAPKMWCIGCKKPYEHTLDFIIMSDDNQRGLCQSCYKTTTAWRWDDLLDELNGKEATE